MSDRDDAHAELRRWYMVAGRAHIASVRWIREVGHARFDGVGVDIFEAPAVAPDAKDIEFIPGVVSTIDGEPMTEDQIKCLRRLLVQMAQEARDALTGQSTLVVVN